MNGLIAFSHGLCRLPDYAASCMRVMEGNAVSHCQLYCLFTKFLRVHGFGDSVHQCLHSSILRNVGVHFFQPTSLIGLRQSDVHIGVGAHLACQGKGRKNRITPLTVPVVNVLRAWLAECDANPSARLFTTRAGTALSRDAIERRIALHVTTASATFPTLGKKNITCHVLRHSAAMRLLEAGVDPTVIALWLGHERVDTTAIYLHAHLGIKEQALDRARMPTAKPRSILSHRQVPGLSGVALIMPTPTARSPPTAWHPHSTSA